MACNAPLEAHIQINRQLTDEAIMAELGRRLMRWRLERNLSQARFGDEAGVGRRTVQRLEAGEPVQLPSLIRVLRTLDLTDGFDRLVPEPLPSPIEHVKLTGRTRLRARAPASVATGEQPKPWRWGDEAEAE